MIYFKFVFIQALNSTQEFDDTLKITDCCSVQRNDLRLGSKGNPNVDLQTKDRRHPGGFKTMHEISGQYSLGILDLSRTRLLVTTVQKMTF